MSHIHPFILLLGAQEVEVAVQKHGIRRRIMITMNKCFKKKTVMSNSEYSQEIVNMIQSFLNNVCFLPSLPILSYPILLD